ncbi:DUF1553 domain-containing protein [Telmatocola sphagniphila]|uniref:DUF1553 domain-containing protein n=1 Tax=Telmatocola sphagniphila TaxID=1123043 RepID=A0A8E6B4R3_9BACT|nr:DUF1553 domain-containing protein [Telmatocola sphagniphila]QVL30365.1 DUF1553 domain-containing protein [Telmatocola sphagniphila]
MNFEKEIQPIFQKHCYSCHGSEKQKGDLRFDRRDSFFKGGGSGPAIVAGKSEASLLMARIQSKNPEEQMPPQGDRLSSAEIRSIKNWIDRGADWPKTSDVDARLTHWAYQPVKRPDVPSLPKDSTAKNPIDNFLIQKLAQSHLKMNPEADKVTLLRRLKFDLLGLPPTPEEVQAFLKDNDPNAYEKCVDKFLAAPQFGERWARHWLDVVRFAETQGFEMNLFRPNAWPYRDYVIRSLNEDKPYDRFVKEQLAGDQLGQGEATGYLVAGAYDMVKGDPLLNAQQRADELHDIIGTTGTTFLGVTLGCARCHDHKFDPVSQADYYGLKAVFAGVQHGERPVKTGQTTVNPLLNEERFPAVEARYVRMTLLKTEGNAEPCIDELEIFTSGPASRNVALAKNGTKVTASGTLPGYAIHKLEFINDGQPGNSHSWISHQTGQGWVQFELPKVEKIDRVVWSRDRLGQFADRLAVAYRIEVAREPDHWQTVVKKDYTVSDGSSKLPYQIYAGRFTAPEKTHRLLRGEITAPKEEMAAAAPVSLGAKLQLPMNAPEEKRRLALADWIVDPKNPLTARVMVNRLWQHHFGAGIVATPSDFGINGAKPVHPELLDWLADEFVIGGWKMKRIHKLIVMSAAYRQASTPNSQGLAADTDARLLWRYPPARLEAEPLRDTILFISGKLDLTAGGPGFDLFEPNSNYVKVYIPKTKFGPPEWRRMIYMTKQRMRVDDTFGAFDCPDAGQTAPKRTNSTTAFQVLNLFNSPFMLQQAGFFAERIQKEAGKESRAQIQRAFWLAYQREPQEAEIGEAKKLIEKHGLKAFCLALFNTNEFLFVF